MKLKLSKTQQYFLGIIFFALFLIVIYFIKNKKFNKILINTKYTISEIYDLKHYSRSSDSYMYSYKVNNLIFKQGISSNSSNNLIVGKRYFVVFEEGNPENSMLIPFLFVPDSITKSPVEGWREPPIPIDKNEIKKFLENY
ncbi:hypothetical protein [Empedobacter stercoris]|uniref:hypothetical protein n=1 Tax=Empedobacter stercoris TaxID=1628248 RepID=UPI001CE0BA77|nr:hypothetical protein [Empedobacter stercoris]MCA4777287.1 hypothetical protein [Empedobacter stercoris]